MTDSAMIKRIAKQMEIAAVEHTMHHPARWELAKLSWLWPIVARAVLEGMREPTDAMIHYGFEAYLNHETGTEVIPIWQSMIDEAAGKEPFQSVSWPNRKEPS